LFPLSTSLGAYSRTARWQSRGGPGETDAASGAQQIQISRVCLSSPRSLPVRSGVRIPTTQSPSSVPAHPLRSDGLAGGGPAAAALHRRRVARAGARSPHPRRQPLQRGPHRRAPIHRTRVCFLRDPSTVLTPVCSAARRRRPGGHGGGHRRRGEGRAGGAQEEPRPRLGPRAGGRPGQVPPRHRRQGTRALVWCAVLPAFTLWGLSEVFFQAYLVICIMVLYENIPSQITERKPELAKLEALDSGKPYDEAIWDMVYETPYQSVQYSFWKDMF
jgi:hypothetical protein